MRLDLRGGTMDPGRTAALLARARTAAFGEVVLRTNALGFQQPEASVALAAQGVHGALVPVFSQHAPVHDRIAGRSGALVQTLVGMRSLASAGLAIEVEVPLLSGRIQDASAVVELVHRAESARPAKQFRPAHEVSWRARWRCVRRAT